MTATDTLSRVSIKCGHCRRTHSSVATVWACGQGNVFACGDLVERWLSDGGLGMERVVIECGADAIGDDDGWSCAAGHAYVSMQVRASQGWDYADEDEAIGMLMAGVEPVRMSNGTSYWDHASVEPSWEQRVEAAARRTTHWGQVRELHRAHND